MKIVLFVSAFLLQTSLYASILDDDMDGVENVKDRCPHSAVTDIVNADGCLVEKLEVKKEHQDEHHFDIMIGYEFTKFKDRTSQSAQSFSLSYYYGRYFSVSFYTANYDLTNGENGIADSTLQTNYSLYHDEDYDVGMGAGVYLPTFDIAENKTDYFLTLSLSKALRMVDISLYAQHTWMNDYLTQDTNLLALDISKTWDKDFYTAFSYTIQDSIYTVEKRAHHVSIDGSYALSEDFFVTATLTKGLSDTAIKKALQISLGYSY